MLYSSVTAILFAANQGAAQVTAPYDVDVTEAAESLRNEERRCTDGSAYADAALRRAWLYVGYAILCAGTAGSLFTAAAIFRTAAASVAQRTTVSGALRPHRFSLLPPVAVYLLYASASGLVALYGGLLPRLVNEQTCGGVHLLGGGRGVGVAADVSCRFASTLEYLAIQFCAWMAACIALDGALATFGPAAYARWFGHNSSFGCGAGSAAPVVVASASALVLFAINAIPFAAYGINEAGECGVLDENLMNAYAYVDTMVYSLLPLAVMTPCNVVVARRLFDGCLCRRRPHTEPPTDSDRRPLVLASLCLNVTLFLTVAQVAVDLQAADLEKRSPDGISGTAATTPADATAAAGTTQGWTDSELPERRGPPSGGGASVGNQWVWSIGMLASYLFCSAPFYVYLIAGVAFRRSPVQLLLAAAGAAHDNTTEGAECKDGKERRASEALLLLDRNRPSAGSNGQEATKQDFTHGYSSVSIEVTTVNSHQAAVAAGSVASSS